MTLQEPDATPFRDPRLARAIADAIRERIRRPMRLMEVCGTHTVSIFRHGLLSLLPRDLTLLSGPGCPVCVTDTRDIDAFIALSREPDTLIATFGDLMRVPGTDSSLRAEAAEGRDIRVVYSPMDALAIARENPHLQVVFPGIGFETTAPAIAATLFSARSEGITNFFVYSAHKTVPRALMALAAGQMVKIDGFLLPGHVSVIIGLAGYGDFFAAHPIPSVVAGFEPVDILRAVGMLVDQVADGAARLENAYPRAVTANGNPKARAVMEMVFMPVDARWRGLGVIPDSGLAICPEFAELDASMAFSLKLPEPKEPEGCACGAILTGVKTPPECPLFRTRCTPLDPVGPCMVSSEGTCAAYYRYHDGIL